MSEQRGWRARLVHELTEYSVNFCYLALFFCVFITYRRLLMAEYEIGYGDYGISIIKALILAKVIMLGDIMRLGRRLENRPLIYPTLFKTVVFTAWVMLFHFLEMTIAGLFQGHGIQSGAHELVNQLPYELLTHLLIIFFAFLPFFAIRELAKVLGEGKLSQLFFRNRKIRMNLEQT